MYSKKEVFRTILFMCTVLTLMSMLSCDNEDDIGTIFTGKTWYMTGGEINGTPITGEELKNIYAVPESYLIYFSPDKSFTGILVFGSSFSGTWTANGKNNSMTLNFNKFENVNGSALSTNIFNILKVTTSYSGDENNIKIKEDSHNYIRLTKSRKSSN